MPPLIGISGRRLVAAQLSGVPAPMLDAAIDVHFTEYAEKVRAAGGLSVQLTCTADPVALVARLDGIVLSGGADVDPRRYGATPGPGQSGFEPARDDFEVALIEAAVARGIPVLGICRGAQIVNVAFGGTLVADLPADQGEGHSSYAYPRHVRTHQVDFVEGTAIGAAYGATRRVNTFHHQSIDRLGDGLVVAATAADGVIEAVEHVDHAIWAVQWHPEMLDDVEPCFHWLSTRAEEQL